MDHYNATVDLLEGNLAAGRGDAVYLLGEDRDRTYAEVAAGADCAGAGLLDAGVAPGDRVVLALSDRPEFALTFWGAIKAGIVPVPVSTALKAGEYRFLLEDSAAKVVIADASTAAAITEAAADLPTRVVLAGDGPDGLVGWDEVCGRAATLTAAPTTAEDVAFWLYTSGTTGQPKGAMHRHPDMRASADTFGRHVLGLRPEDRIYSASKMFFAYGLGNSVFHPAAAGACAVLSAQPGAPAFVRKLLAKHAPTVLFGVPSFYGALAATEPDPALFASVRLAVSAGESLPVALFEKYRDDFGVTIYDGIGSTENLQAFTSNRPDALKPGSSGQAVPGYEVEVRDEAGAPAPVDERGELWVRGPSQFVGYWQRPELTERAVHDGWVRTGDAVHRDADGFIWHEGRLDDLVKVGGMWVAPREVEELLKGVAGVADVAVVGGQDAGGLPELTAYVIADEGHETFEAQANLQAHMHSAIRPVLAAYKLPRRYEFVAELPRTATGKLRRFMLRDQPKEG